MKQFGTRFSVYISRSYNSWMNNVESRGYLRDNRKKTFGSVVSNDGNIIDLKPPFPRSARDSHIKVRIRATPLSVVIPKLNNQ